MPISQPQGWQAGPGIEPPHPLTNLKRVKGYLVDAIVGVNDVLSHKNIQFILDSGAAVSVANYEIVGKFYHRTQKQHRFLLVQCYLSKQAWKD